eukprot:10916058-Alexandrium_andersonii.AAC.1
MLFLKWSFRVMASGRHPTLGPDGREWAVDDPRRALGGSALKAKGACVFIKGDWMEFTERFGFPSHSSSMRPCFCCSTP